MSAHPRRGHGRRYHPRALAQFAAVVAVTVAVFLALDHIQDAAPHLDVDAVAPGTPAQRGGEETFLVCERRLPGQPQEVTPGDVTVGRVRSGEVVACPDEFDGRTVEFVGEAVGEVLERDGGAWLLVNDDAYALESGPLPAHDVFAGTNTGLSVWLPADVIDLDGLVTGGPGRRGDILALHGRFLRADPADGGGMTLRASEAEVVVPAADVEPPFHGEQAIGAAVAVAVTAGLAGSWRLARRRR